MFPADGNPKREAIPLVNRPGTRINRAQANVQNPADIANSERAADQPGGDGAKDSGHPLATLPIKTNAACANVFNTVGQQFNKKRAGASPSHQLDGQNRRP